MHFSSLISPDGFAPAALASLLFYHPEPQIIGKTQCFATFLPFRSFSRICIFSPLTLPTWLCFSSVHIVRSLTSKLPSIRNILCLEKESTTRMTLPFQKLMRFAVLHSLKSRKWVIQIYGDLVPANLTSSIILK